MDGPPAVLRPAGLPGSAGGCTAHPPGLPRQPDGAGTQAGGAGRYRFAARCAEYSLRLRAGTGSEAHLSGAVSGGISPTLLARSFQKNAEMVCEYRVLSSAGDGIDYQGTVLLNSRAVRLLSYVEDTSGNEKVRTIQSKELWLAEDMTFYVVSCMSTITMDKEEAICLNEHRSVVTTVECEDDIFFDMGSLICELDDICLFELLADVDATIYEL